MIEIISIIIAFLLCIIAVSIVKIALKKQDKQTEDLKIVLECINRELKRLDSVKSALNGESGQLEDEMKRIKPKAYSDMNRVEIKELWQAYNAKKSKKTLNYGKRLAIDANINKLRKIAEKVSFLIEN